MQRRALGVYFETDRRKFIHRRTPFSTASLAKCVLTMGVNEWSFIAQSYTGT